MKEVFIDWKPQQAARDLLEKANTILNNYASQGYDLTLRQLYYRLIALDLFPEDKRWRKVENSNKWVKDPNGTKNADPNYKWLGRIVGDGRLAGYLDWEHLVDRGRETKHNSHWENPKSILESAASSFAIDKWENQPCHIEVIVEKDALSGVLAPVCYELDVRFTANKGYSSLSHMYRIGKRIYEMLEQGKPVMIFYLGDHDPSGLDMDRDIFSRLHLFSYGEGDLNLERLALTMDQIEEQNPPPAPAKITDSRAKMYIKQYGNDSWELDALEPSVLAELVRNWVTQYRDEDQWNADLEREKEMKGYIEEVAKNYKG